MDFVGVAHVRRADILRAIAENPPKYGPRFTGVPSSILSHQNFMTRSNVGSMVSKLQNLTANFFEDPLQCTMLPDRGTLLREMPVFGEQ